MKKITFYTLLSTTLIPTVAFASESTESAVVTHPSTPLAAREQKADEIIKQNGVGRGDTPYTKGVKVQSEKRKLLAGMHEEREKKLLQITHQTEMKKLEEEKLKSLEEAKMIKASKEAEIKRLADEKQKSEDEAKKATSSLVQLRIDFEENKKKLEDEKKQSEDEAKTATSSLAELRIDFEANKKKLDEVTKRTTELETQQKSLSSELEKVKISRATNSESLQTELDKITAELTAKKREILELENKNAVLGKKLEIQSSIVEVLKQQGPVKVEKEQKEEKGQKTPPRKESLASAPVKEQKEQKEKKEQKGQKTLPREESLASAPVEEEFDFLNQISVNIDAAKDVKK